MRTLQNNCDIPCFSIGEQRCIVLINTDDNYTTNCIPAHQQLLNKTRVVIWSIAHLGTCTLTGEKVRNANTKRLCVSVSLELSSGPLEEISVEKKYLEEKNTSSFQLSESRIYDKCSLDYSRRDKNGLA